MNRLVEFLKECEGKVFVDEDGTRTDFKLLEPMTENEIGELTSRIPCPLPAEIAELLRFSRGFDGTWLQEIRFATMPGFNRGSIFPAAMELANDGCGNYWILDLTRDSAQWGPIFYACHDAPVIVFQADGLLHFLQEAVREGSSPRHSEIEDVRNRLSEIIWSDNPGVLSYAHCVNGPDPDLKRFAKGLGETWLVVDLRTPTLGDGFSWGRYGPRTPLKRFGEKRIFAYQKKTLLRRFMESFR
jgi:hypothetical protein